MKNADQPAYPSECASGIEWTDSKGKKIKERSSFNGLTKREMFAAMAMQGILSSGLPVDGRTIYHPDAIAVTATRYADELLKQLES